MLTQLLYAHCLALNVRRLTSKAPGSTRATGECSIIIVAITERKFNQPD